MLNSARYVQKQDGVLIVGLGPVKDRQEGLALANDLADLAAALLLDNEVHVVVLAGSEEEAFRVEGEPLASEGEENAASERGGGSLAGPIAALEVPVIAAISGDALGQGLELALACDVRIAAETSRFGLPQIMQGCLPHDGGTQRLGRLVGKGKALEMILTGQPIDAQEALRIGLVNRILPREEVTAAALALAREMAAKAPISMRYAKEAIREGTEMTLDQGLRLEGDLYLLLQTTRDRTEGIGAFHRREEPRFEGR